MIMDLLEEAGQTRGKQIIKKVLTKASYGTIEGIQNEVKLIKKS